MVLMALRGVYNSPFNLDDPVYVDPKIWQCTYQCKQALMDRNG